MTPDREDRRRQTLARLDRLASSVSPAEQVADQARMLSDSIESVRDPATRLPLWGESLSFLVHRCRADWKRTTGIEPPLEGPPL